MPGMMDTILNLGMNDKTVEIVAAKSGNPTFRLGQLPPLPPDVWRRRHGRAKTAGEDHEPFESIIEHLKDERYGNHDFPDTSLPSTTSRNSCPASRS